MTVFVQRETECSLHPVSHLSNKTGGRSVKKKSPDLVQVRVRSGKKRVEGVPGIILVVEDVDVVRIPTPAKTPRGFGPFDFQSVIGHPEFVSQLLDLSLKFAGPAQFFALRIGNHKGLSAYSSRC